MTDGNTALPVSPVQTEEETMKVADFFRGLADKVVQASHLPKELEKTQSELSGLRHDFENERNHSTMLDQQLLDMRNQRNAAEDELAKVRQELEETKRALGSSEAQIGRLTSQLSSATDNLASTRKDRDEYGLKAMQLEEDLKKSHDTLKEFKTKIGALFPEPKPEPTPEPVKPEPVQAAPETVQEPHPVQQTGEVKPPYPEDVMDEWRKLDNVHQDRPEPAPHDEQDRPGYAQTSSNRW